MTPEELLKPRYKLIADYPGNTVAVNTIFEPEYYIDQNKTFYQSYPNLFCKLQWWEQRKPEDMPAYILAGKLESSHTFYKLIEPIPDMYGFWKMQARGREHVYPLGDVCSPATKEEWDAQENL